MSKVPKKIKTLTKRGERRPRQEFTEDVAPKSRLDMNDVVRVLDIKHLDELSRKKKTLTSGLIK